MTPAAKLPTLCRRCGSIVVDASRRTMVQVDDDRGSIVRPSELCDSCADRLREFLGKSVVPEPPAPRTAVDSLRGVQFRRIPGGGEC